VEKIKSGHRAGRVKENMVEEILEKMRITKTE
jgi:hypothetical protein